MNKMEILKNAFEKIGYRTELEYDEDDERYILEIVDDDLEPSVFNFDKNYEPMIWTGGYGLHGEWLSLDEYYKELDKYSEEEDF